MKTEHLKHRGVPILKQTEFSIAWINTDGDAIDRLHSEADNRTDAEKEFRAHLQKWGMPEDAVAWVIEERIDFFPSRHAPKGQAIIFETLGTGGNIEALQAGGWVE